MMRRARAVFLWLGAACALVPAPALAQGSGANLQKRANAVLSLMGYMLTPDVTTGNLAISNDATGNPDLSMTTLGGGFTATGEYPLYLEGTVGYAQYDPTFVIGSGPVQGSVAAKWDAYSATGGIGWSFALAQELAFRPVFNFSYGRVDSNVSATQTGSGEEFDFLHNGHLNAHGLGGSLILDYERYRPENEIDLELRYTNIHLKSFGGSSTAVQGSADRAEPELLVALARADRRHAARAAAALRARVRPHAVLRRPGGGARLQPAQLARHRPRARHQRLRRPRDAHPPDGPLPVRRARQGLVDRARGQLLSGPTAPGSAPAACA